MIMAKIKAREWLVRFEHCSDNTQGVYRKAPSYPKALQIAAEIATKHLDRCDDAIANQIQTAYKAAEYEKAVDLFIADQEAGGDCELEVVPLNL